MNNITLHIYDKAGKEVVKMYEAQPYDLPFGTVRALMEILKVEDMTNQAELLRVLANAWDEIVSVLNGVFPECTDDEWNRVKTKEVLRVIIDIAKFAISDIFVIPTEKN
jgi:hypothetical protein